MQVVAGPGADCVEPAGMLAPEQPPAPPGQVRPPEPIYQQPYVQQPPSAPSGPQYDPHVIHGSTPLGQIGVNVCPIPVDPVMAGNNNNK